MATLQINWLEMQDFGAYKGKHKVEFANNLNGKPVTLFGGLNGAGKTTLLEAILFVLHGKNAPTQKRSKNKYQDYLAKLINRNSSKSEAVVTLNFSSIENSNSTIWEISRYIIRKKTNHHESIHVKVDGKNDDVMAARWPIEVESLWPRHLCNILFFDGERLKELASPEATSAALKEAMRLLLGGLPVSRAVGDLKELEKRLLQREDISAPDREKLSALQLEIEGQEQEVVNLKSSVAAFRTRQDSMVLKRDRLEQEFSSKGGELVMKTREHQSEGEVLSKERQVLMEQMQSLAAGFLPLALLSEQLGLLRSHCEEESEYSRNVQVNEFLRGRDQEFINWLGETRTAETPEFLADIQQWLQNNRPQIEEGTEVFHEPGLLNDMVYLESSLDEERLRAASMVKRLSEVERALLDSERLLSNLPGEEDIILMKENLLNLEAQTRHIAKQIADFEEQIDRKKQHLVRLGQSLDILIKKAGKSVDKQSAGTRVLEQLPDLIAFFKKYEDALLLNSLAEMETHIFGCLTYLFKEEKVITKLSIDTETFEIRLLGENSETIEIERLSAGERQMLATSIIWALSKLSGNSAPVIIDTPVSRLDGDYRAKFIGTYLPNAGNQVIVLSTDEEIHETYYPLLEEFIGAEYGLRYERSTQSTEIAKGYPYKFRLQEQEDETRSAAA